MRKTQHWVTLGAAMVVAGVFFIAQDGLASRPAYHRAQALYAGPVDKVIAVGHRGAKHFAPENTLASYDKAVALGARVVEIDARATADGHFVAMHDPWVNRTTDGAGLVSMLTLAEIERLDAGSWFGAEFAGEKVPTLREALRHLKGRAAIDIDFKSGPANSGELIAAILDEEGYADGPLVTIFARAWSYDKVKAASPRYALRPVWRGRDLAGRQAHEDGVEIFGMRRRAFSFERAQEIRNDGFTLFANTMGADDNERSFADNVLAGARFIQTDNLDLLAPFLAERGLLMTCVPARDFSCWTPRQEVVS
ncbi:MAG: glycerophosphodiester phosphodiesterase family protein [Parvularculaceae bacterium]